MWGGSTSKIDSKITATLCLSHFRCMWNAISVAQCKAQRREVADSNSPCNPIVTGKHGDAAAPHWQCGGWWMMPCWTSLRGASHNRSFLKALVHTAAWGTAWKVISINSQPSSSAISKHNLELRNIIVFLLPLPLLCSSQHNGELAEWCSFDDCCHDNINLVIIEEELSLNEKTFCKNRKVHVGVSLADNNLSDSNLRGKLLRCYYGLKNLKNKIKIKLCSVYQIN